MPTSVRHAPRGPIQNPEGYIVTIGKSKHCQGVSLFAGCQKKCRSPLNFRRRIHRVQVAGRSGGRSALGSSCVRTSSAHRPIKAAVIC